MMELTIGAQLGNYRLLRLIGVGGFAQVYLAEHVYLETQAAIKVLSYNASMERFLKEAKIVARLRHPAIISVLEFGVEADRPYLVMEYAPHGSLRARHPNGVPLPLATVVDYVRQVAAALQYAHEHRVIHCDVKPENMLIGEDDRVLLSDFGIARLVQSSLQSQTAKDIAGTIFYMAPEQFAGKPGAASDQYALGVVVYEWLSGKNPFEGDNIAEIFYMHTRMEPPSLNQLDADIPSAIADVVKTAMAKEPRQRYPNMASFAEAFEQAAKPQLSVTGFAIGMAGSFSYSPQHQDQPTNPEPVLPEQSIPAPSNSFETLLPPLLSYLPVDNIQGSKQIDIEENLPTQAMQSQPPQVESNPPPSLSIDGDSDYTLVSVPLPTLTEMLPLAASIADESTVPDSSLLEGAPAGEADTQPETVFVPPPALEEEPSATIILPSMTLFLPREQLHILSERTEPEQVYLVDQYGNRIKKVLQQVEIFISYSHKDRNYRERLDEHLWQIRHHYPATVWNDGELRPGVDFQREIEKRLQEANIILLLVSAHFISSEYCRENELKTAMERHHLNEAHVIPVILKPTLWHIAPFGKLRALPRDGKPISSWKPSDAGYADVAKGVEQLIKDLLGIHSGSKK